MTSPNCPLPVSVALRAFRSRFRPAFCAALCLASPLFSQSLTKEPANSFRLLTLENAITDWYYLDGAKRIPVAANASTKSEHYTIPKDGALRFYRDGLGKDGNPQPALVGSVNLDPEWKSPLVLIASDRSQPEKRTLTAYNEDPSLFPAGSIRLINNSEAKILARLSDQKVTVGPRRVETLSLQSPSLRMVDVELSTNFGGAIQPIYRRGWELAPSMRITVFIVKGSDGYFHTFRLQEDQATFLPRKPER